MDVCLLRQSGKSSFVVQLSPSSGVVEVHCVQVEAAAAKDLDSALQMMTGRSKHGIGGFSAPYRRGWRVTLAHLGKYDLKARGFLRCRIRFEKVDGWGEEDGCAKKVVEQPPRKKKMRWLQKRLP